MSGNSPTPPQHTHTGSYFLTAFIFSSHPKATLYLFILHRIPDILENSVKIAFQIKN